MSTTPPASDDSPAKPIVSSDHRTLRSGLKGLAILCFGVTLWLVVENISSPISFRLLGEHYQMSLGALLAVSGALLGIAASLFFYSIAIITAKQTQVSQRKVERLEVTAESSSERVKVLEHKIETLEAALKRALGKS